MIAALLATLVAVGTPDDEIDALWEQGARAEAIAALEQRLAETDDDATRLRLGHAQLAVHRYEAAARTAAPLGDAGRSVSGPALYVLTRYEEALPLLDDDDPLDVLMKLDALVALGRLDDADALLPVAERVRGADDAELLVHRGQSHARAGEHAEAVVLFERALSSDPYEAAALYGLGTSLVRSGRRAEGLAKLTEHRELVPLLDALDFAQRGVDLDPRHAGNWGALGDAERALGRLGHANDAYAYGVTHARSGAEATPVLLRWTRMIHEDHDDLDRAVALLDNGWENHRDVRLLVRAGDLLAEAGRIDEALARYDAALAVVPDQPAIVARRRDAEAAR